MPETLLKFLNRCTPLGQYCFLPFFFMDLGFFFFLFFFPEQTFIVLDKELVEGKFIHGHPGVEGWLVSYLF